MAKFKIKKSGVPRKPSAFVATADAPAGMENADLKRFNEIAREIHGRTQLPVDEVNARLQEYADLRRQATHSGVPDIVAYEQLATDYLDLFISHKQAAFEGYRLETGKDVRSDAEADALGIGVIVHPDLFRKYFSTICPRDGGASGEPLHRSAISLEGPDGRFYGALQGGLALKGSPANWGTNARLRSNGARTSNHPLPRCARLLNAQFRDAALKLSSVLKVPRRDLESLMHRCYEARFALHEVNPLTDQRATEITALITEYLVPRHIERVREIRAEQTGRQRSVRRCIKLARPEFIAHVQSDELFEQIRDHDGPIPGNDSA